ncbi:MAG: phosphotransferase [Propionibacteriaceae bacterium]
MDERAARLLRRHGWERQAELGSGMEGTVVEVSADRVAKIWHGRSRADVDALVRFSAALDDQAPPFTTPRVFELLEEDDLVITIERRLHGQPLADRPHPDPPLVDAHAICLLGDVLAGLSDVTISPDLAGLPILPGERPFDGPAPFPLALAALVERRFKASPEGLRREMAVDDLVAPLAGRLRDLPPTGRTAVLHGDLIPANVLVQDGRVSAVLDFGFLTTVGDPHFDAAITASIFDMYGPRARASEDLLSEAFVARFGHEVVRYGLYRAAYAIVTHAYFGTDGADGHFRWCADMLRRPDVTAAVLG